MRVRPSLIQGQSNIGAAASGGRKLPSVRAGEIVGFIAGQSLYVGEAAGTCHGIVSDKELRMLDRTMHQAGEAHSLAVGEHRGEIGFDRAYRAADWNVSR